MEQGILFRNIRILAFIAGGLCSLLLLYQGQASADEPIAGFSLGVWTYLDDEKASDAKVADSCKKHFSLVLADGRSLTFFVGDLLGKNKDDKKLRLTAVETCDTIRFGEPFTCNGLTYVSETKTEPQANRYLLDKIGGGRVKMVALISNSPDPPLALYPYLCSDAVVYELFKAGMRKE